MVSAKAARYGAEGGGGSAAGAPRTGGSCGGAGAARRRCHSRCSCARGGLGGREGDGREGGRTAAAQPTPAPRPQRPAARQQRPEPPPRPARRRDQLIAHVGAPQEVLKGVGARGGGLALQGGRSGGGSAAPCPGCCRR